MPLPVLVLVGGFLGSGKTTLILKAAELLRKQGRRTAIILNDQDAGLVDTQHALARDMTVKEIADGCFCCRFSEFVAAVVELASDKPDVIFAEPVGSCADLCATVIRPLQEMYADLVHVAPLTVLLDPGTAEVRLAESLDSDVGYLAAHQLAEADLVCTTKRDLNAKAPALPFPVDFELSGLTGVGVENWLNEVLEPNRVSGARPLDIDYTRYAQAEAALGWLNLHARIDLESAQSPALLGGPLLDRIEDSLTQEGIAIAHLKIFDRTATGWVKASICGNGADASAEGDLLAEPVVQHEFVVNVRAVATPQRLQEIVSGAITRLEGKLTISYTRAFSPPPPVPEYRRPEPLRTHGVPNSVNLSNGTDDRE